MAIDTEDKRRSAAQILWPSPDASIDVGDRAQLSHAYRGVFEAAIGQVLTPDPIAFSLIVIQPAITSGDLMLTPDAIPFSFTVQEPIFGGTGSSDVLPDSIPFSYTVQPLAIRFNPDPIQFSFDVVQPVVNGTGSSDIAADSIPFDFDVVDPLVSGTGSAIILPDSIPFSFTVQGPDVLLGAIITPGVIAFSFAVQSVDVISSGVSLVTPDPVAFTVELQPLLPTDPSTVGGVLERFMEDMFCTSVSDAEVSVEDFMIDMSETASQFEE